MKAFINRDTLIQIIKDHTVFSKAKDVPEHFQWYQFASGFLTWDFAVMDRVLVDVEVEVSESSTFEYGEVSPEQKARDLLERMEIAGAQEFSAGELVELANLFVK